MLMEGDRLARNKNRKKSPRKKNVRKASKKKPKKRPLPKRKARIPAKKRIRPKKRPATKARKAPKPKKTIITKREVGIAKKKKKKREIVALTPEEMAKISEILSRPVIRQLLVDVGGENAIAIVRNFSRGMSDEDISKALSLKISDVRAALNRLHSEGIVAYNREKDSETGWYSYSWYLDTVKMEKWAWESVRKFETQESNGGEYYVCPTCGNSTIIAFETAFDKGFRCDICNHALEYLDEKRKEGFGMMQVRKRL